MQMSLQRTSELDKHAPSALSPDNRLMRVSKHNNRQTKTQASAPTCRLTHADSQGSHFPALLPPDHFEPLARHGRSVPIPSVH